MNMLDRQVILHLNKEDLFILRAILSEIYAGVCVDSDEFEIIHGIEKEKILKLSDFVQSVYDGLE